jgi:AraC-like DNA-binding protein
MFHSRLQERTKEDTPRRPLPPEPANRTVPRFGDLRRRKTLHSGSLISVEDCYIPPRYALAPIFEPAFQVCLPYHGIFSYAVGNHKWTLDRNQTLFISPGWEVREEQPIEDLGHAAVLLNPSMELLDEVGLLKKSKASEAFERCTGTATIRSQLFVQHILCSSERARDPLQLDQWTIELLKEAVGAPLASNGKGSRAVERAKEFLHDRRAERLSLGQIARCVGVSPVYLTAEFSRHQGMPLYRYQLRLRLAEALSDLPHCGDITRLALDLGFSSHSHFSASFRKAFGLSPSDYRSKIGTSMLNLSLPN